MCSLYILVWLMATCFMNTFGKDLRLQGLDLFLKQNHEQGFLLRKQGRRETESIVDGQFWRGVKEKLINLDNPAASTFLEFLRVTTVRNFDPGLTIEASFLGVADHTWVLYDGSSIVFTKGTVLKENNIISTSINVKTGSDGKLPGSYILLLNYDSFIFLFSFNTTAVMFTSTEEFYTDEFVLFSDDEVSVDANGNIALETLLPSTFTNISDHLQLLVAYTDGMSDSVQYARPNYNMSKDAYQKTVITISGVPSMASGVLSVKIIGVNELDPSWTYANFFVEKLIKIRSSNPLAHRDFVRISDESTMARYLVGDDGVIDYGSVACVAYGSPKPELELSRNGEVVNQHSVFLSQLMAIAYVPLDGQTLEQVGGEYTCRATSGSSTDTATLDRIPGSI